MNPHRFLSALLALALAAGASAHSPVDPATLEPGHPTGNLRHAGQTWPPQPDGIANVIPLSDPVSERVETDNRSRRAQRLERSALGRRDVRDALGTRYRRLALIEGRNKDGTARPSRLVYFSHERNATVKVVFNGDAPASVQVIPPTEYQPEPSVEETLEATAIARQFFSDRGRTGIADLEGFGILAYRPTGKGFFDSRVIYISFHRDRAAPPECAAWVDLTHRNVIRWREESPAVSESAP